MKDSESRPAWLRRRRKRRWNSNRQQRHPAKGGEEIPPRKKRTIRANAVAMEIEVCPAGVVSLRRQDAPAANIVAAEEGLEGFQYRGLGALGQQAEQRLFALECVAQHSRDGEGPVPVRNGG